MQFLIEYGYLILFIYVFLDQAGLPLPSIPVLLAAGSLSAMGEMNLYFVVFVTVLACIPADFFWYQLGRTRGGKVLGLLCSISLEPDHCVRKTESSFDRLGPYSLIIAKFVPGLQSIAPPMAGLAQIPTAKFLTLDILGALIWAASLSYLGFLFSNEITELASRFAELGGIAVGIVIVSFSLFIAFKFVQRKIYIRSLRMRMIRPAELNEKLDAGESIYVIDLRHRLDFNALPYTIPVAVRVPMEHINEYQEQIPRDRDIVLYCS